MLFSLVTHTKMISELILHSSCASIDGYITHRVHIGLGKTWMNQEDWNTLWAKLQIKLKGKSLHSCLEFQTCQLSRANQRLTWCMHLEMSYAVVIFTQYPKDTSRVKVLLESGDGSKATPNECEYLFRMK